MIYDVDMETLPREDLYKLQLSRLQNLCERLYANVPFYQNLLQNCGYAPGDVRSFDDLSNLPFTTKQDLRDNYPYGLFAAPRDTIVRLHASSGTTGKATVVGYTKRDIENWSELVARCLSAAGIRRGDTIQNTYGYGLFTGGLGMHYGAEKLGATVIPVSGGNTKRQAHILKDFGATAITATPSFALYFNEIAEQEGIIVKDLPLRVGVFGAEPWTEEMRKTIEEKMGISAVNIYGLSEIMGPGVAQECAHAKNGMHIFEDHFIPEIIDPDTGQTLAPGEVGELVITTITKEGIPLLRYRTKDMTSLNYTPCSCGRTHVRINRLMGRSDDMLIIRGVNVYPQQIESFLVETHGLSPHYEIVVTREGQLDQLELKVELTEAMFAKQEIRHLQNIERTLRSSIKDYLGISTKIRLVEPQSLPRYEGKASRVTDLRQII